jgi:hypothetical protein
MKGMRSRDRAWKFRDGLIFFFFNSQRHHLESRVNLFNVQLGQDDDKERLGKGKEEERKSRAIEYKRPREIAAFSSFFQMIHL